MLHINIYIYIYIYSAALSANSKNSESYTFFLHCNEGGSFDFCVANSLECLLTLFCMAFVFFTFDCFQPNEDLLRQHYAELKERPFFPKLVKYMSSGPVVPMVCLIFGIVSTT